MGLECLGCCSSRIKAAIAGGLDIFAGDGARGTQTIYLIVLAAGALP